MSVPPNLSRGANRCVVAMADGYDVAALAPFVLSLRRVYNGDVVVFGRPDEETGRFLAAHRIAVMPGGQTEGWTPHPVVARLADFEALARALPPSMPLFITDSRDVVFQSDPFTEPIDTLEVFNEGVGQPLGAHLFNMKYLRALIGAQAAARIAHRPPVCVGTVAGRAGDVGRLFRAMLGLGAIPRSAIGGAFGADQAAFNAAVHLHLVEAVIRPNFTRVATIGWLRDDQFAVSAEGWIESLTGARSPVVHQYDRHRVSMEAVGRRLGVTLVERSDRRETLARRWRRLQGSLLRSLPELR